MITYLIVDFGVCSGLVFGRFIARSHVFCCVFRGPVRIGGGNSKESGEEEELLIQ